MSRVETWAWRVRTRVARFEVPAGFAFVEGGYGEEQAGGDGDGEDGGRVADFAWLHHSPFLWRCVWVLPMSETTLEYRLIHHRRAVCLPARASRKDPTWPNRKAQEEWARGRGRYRDQELDGWYSAQPGLVGSNVRDTHDCGSAVGCRVLHFPGRVPDSEDRSVEYCGWPGHDDGGFPDDVALALSARRFA